MKRKSVTGISYAVREFIPQVSSQTVIYVPVSTLKDVLKLSRATSLKTISQTYGKTVSKYSVHLSVREMKNAVTAIQNISAAEAHITVGITQMTAL